MPIDSDPDIPARAHETRTAPHRPGSPDVQASPQAPGSPEVHRRQDAADFRQQQIAEHLRSRRVVATTYESFEAREAWAEAVPHLRAAWEEHKERYPGQVRPAPRTQPDGGWAADGGRRLTPEQNAEATKACADLRDEADQVILPAIRRVEAASPDGHLAGLDHMLKGEDRLKEKIAAAMEAPDVTVGEAIDLVPDAVRFTLTYDAERYADAVLADVGRLNTGGFELVKLKNLWHTEQYKGVNSQWRRPDTGLRFEMQFHTFESMEAKELTHEAYERIRGQIASSTEKLELEQFQRRVNALLATPPGTDRIKDFPNHDNAGQSYLLRHDRCAYEPGEATKRAPADGDWRGPDR